MHGVWRYWAPPLERSKLATTAFTGSYAGAVFGLPLSAWLVSYAHWSMPFYFYGLFLMFFLIYFIVLNDSLSMIVWRLEWVILGWKIVTDHGCSEFHGQVKVFPTFFPSVDFICPFRIALAKKLLEM